jgi:4-hydroxybenzoate polyprenyltransferase
MKYYFYLAMAVLIFIGFYLWKATDRDQYRTLHNILKLLLLLGVFSLILIDTSLLIDKVIDRLN